MTPQFSRNSLEATTPVVTGVGVVHPAATTPEALWKVALSGPSSISTIRRFEAATYDCRIAGQVDDSELESAITPRKRRTSTHVAQLALAAAARSASNAGICTTNSGNVGVCVGTALGGWTQAEQQYSLLMQNGARRINPFVATGASHFAPSIEIADAFQASGPNYTFSSGCPASTQAISFAAELVRNGSTDSCLCGGSESPVSPMIVASLSRTGELSRRNDSPNSASRPFDRGHDGLVLSEGSCFLVLESASSALGRGAKILAAIVGSGGSCDANGMFQTPASHDRAATGLWKALASAKITPDQIDYVCAHANSSPAFDRKEVLVLKKAFGEFAAKIPVSSIKGVLGHPFGASGAFQTAAAAMAIQNDLIPPTHNLEEPDPECDLDLVIGEPRKKTVRHALVTSYGYGGINSYLLLRKVE